MKQPMHTSSYFWKKTLFSMIPGLLFGLLLILLPVNFLIRVLFVLLGVLAIVSAIPTLVLSLTVRNEAVGRLSLISSLIAMVMGFLLIFAHNDVILIVIGAYFVVLPLVEILMAKERMRQFKCELPRLIIGALLLIFGTVSILELIFDVLGLGLIALTVVMTGIAVIAYLKRQKKSEAVTGNRIFVDRNGDGTIDAVFVDTTGDGKPDTEKTYRENK